MNDGGSIVLTIGFGSRRGTPDATVGSATRGALLAMLPRSRSNWPRAGCASTP